MRQLTLVPLTLILCLLLFGCSQEKEAVQAPDNTAVKVDYSLMDLAEVYEDLGELTGDSPLIAEVVLTGEAEKVTYEGADFILSGAKITDVVKGEATNKDQEIKILEVESFNMNLTKPSDRFILFLDRYEGPVTDDEVYVITGVYQGKYGIDGNNNVIYDAGEYGGEVTFQSRVAQTSVEEFKKSITMTLK